MKIIEIDFASHCYGEPKCICVRKANNKWHFGGLQMFPAYEI